MGTLKVDGHIEGNYIKANWLYTSAATAKTSVDKIACIGSDNFIYYITPANMSVGYASSSGSAPWSGITNKPNLTLKRDNDYSYNNLASYYANTTPTYYRIKLPDAQLNMWSMVTLELLVKQKYDSTYHGKILIDGYHSTGNWTAITASVDGYLSTDIKVYGSDSKYLYIAGCSAWGTLALNKMIVADAAAYQDLTGVTIDQVASLPSTYQTATMVYGLTSSNYTSYTVTKTGSGASGTWGINITGNAGSATYLKDSSNNTATYVNYGASGITSTSWMAAWNGYELRAMSPDYVCASRLYSTDSAYKYSSSAPYYGYLTYSSPYWDFKVYPATPSDVRVSRAYTAGSADSATNADKVDGYHASSFAFQGSHNNLTASGNEFTFASSGFSGPMYVNYRTAGGSNGNITEYIFQNGAGSNAAIQCSGGYMSGGLAIVNHTQNNSYDALLFVSHHSTNEWGVTIDKNGSYDYGLYINCGQGNYGLSLNGGLLLYNGVGYGSSFPSNPATGRVFFKI